MLRPTPYLRHSALALVLSVVAFGTACGSDGSADGVGTSTDAGSGNPNGNDARTASDGAAIDPVVGRPTVVSTAPRNAASGVSPDAAIRATFSEPMAASTMNVATFGVKQGALVVAGRVTYFDGTATFQPASPLALNAVYTATITVGATDAAGNALAAAYTWSFTTDATAPLGPSPVVLGAAGSFAILSKAALTNVPTSIITGNVGLSPAAATYVTGLAMTRAGTRWTSAQVIGSVFAADSDAPTPSDLTAAISSMETAYTDAAGRATPAEVNLNGGALGGLVLAPGLYKFNTSVSIDTDVTLAGSANDVWIFEITGDLLIAAGKRMIMSGSPRPGNVFWQIAGAADVGANAHAEGIVLSQTAITLQTGASLNGRLFAQTAVNLAGNAVTAPAP